MEREEYKNMHNYDTLILVIKASIPVIRKLIAEVKRDRLRFNIGTNGLFIHKLRENGLSIRIETSCFN